MRGSLGALIRLRMPEHLAALARHAAQQRGISATEWWRQAGLAAIAAQVAEK